MKYCFDIDMSWSIQGENGFNKVGWNERVDARLCLFIAVKAPWIK